MLEFNTKVVLQVQLNFNDAKGREKGNWNVSGGHMRNDRVQARAVDGYGPRKARVSFGAGGRISPAGVEGIQNSRATDGNVISSQVNATAEIGPECAATPAEDCKVLGGDHLELEAGGSEGTFQWDKHHWDPNNNGAQGAGKVDATKLDDFVGVTDEAGVVDSSVDDEDDPECRVVASRNYSCCGVGSAYRKANLFCCCLPEKVWVLIRGTGRGKIKVKVAPDDSEDEGSCDKEGGPASVMKDDLSEEVPSTKFILVWRGVQPQDGKNTLCYRSYFSIYLLILYA